MLAKSKPKNRQNKTTKKSQWGIKTNSLSAGTKPIKQSRFPSAYSQPIHPRNTANRHKTQSYWIVSLFIVERERGGYENDYNLVEDPERMFVSAGEEFGDGGGIFGIDVSVVDEVFTGVFGVVSPRVLRQPPHQPQHLTVGSQRLLHFSVNH